MTFAKIFRNIFKGVATGVKVVDGILDNPLIGGAVSLIPGGAAVKNWLNSINEYIINAELRDPSTGQGARKFTEVYQQFNLNHLSTVNATLAVVGKRLKYSDEKFKNYVAKQVDAYNAAQELEDSFTLVDLEPPS